MQKQLKRNLLLLAILAALLGYATLFPLRQPPDDAARLLSDNPDSLAVYAFENSQAELRYRLTRQDEDWQLEIPGEDPQAAAGMRVDAFIESLKAPSRQSWHADAIPGSETGLDDPRYRVDIDGRSIMVGNRGALGNQRYVRDGDRILLISDIILYHLQRDPHDFLAGETPEVD